MPGGCPLSSTLLHIKIFVRHIYVNNGFSINFLIFLSCLFTLLDGILAGVDGILAGVDGILAGVDGILAGVDSILAGVDGILAGVDGILASSRFSCSCDILSFSQICKKRAFLLKRAEKSVRFLGSGRARKVKIKGTHDHQQKAYAFLVPAEQKL